MLKDTIRALRKARGFSQEDLAIRLNVVRQTVSKWERGLSVPDSEMLIALGEVFGVSVGYLLGETVDLEEADDLRVISEKLESINLQLANGRIRRRQVAFWGLFVFFLIQVGVFLGLFLWGSPYLVWDYSDPEMAVLGVGIHVFEWVFIRFFPLCLLGSLGGMLWLRR